MLRAGIFLLLILFSNLAFADSIRVPSNLTERQAAELQAQAAKLAEENTQSTNPVTAIQQVDQWVTVGASIGKGIAGTAKELGVVANEFIQTPVGKLTAYLIIWKVAGHDLVRLTLHVVGGVSFFTVMFTFWIWFFRRMCFNVTITETISSDEKPVKTKVTERKKNDDEGYLVICIIGLVLIIAVSLFTIFTY